MLCGGIVIKPTLRVFLAICVMFVGAACSHKYKVDAINAPNKLIPANSHYYVMLPKDGQYGTTEYIGSSSMVVSAVEAVLTGRSGKVTKAISVESMEEALESAKLSNSDYIFRPIIVHWEDRATEWSGRPDRITMRYTILDAETGDEIASTLARASSKWGTFGGDHPQDLVPETVEAFINSVAE